MAFLPAISPTQTADKKQRNERRGDDSKKNYRISLSNLARTTGAKIATSTDKEPSCPVRDSLEETNIPNTGNSYQSKQCGHQSLKKPKSTPTEPITHKSPDSVISGRSMFWMEPLGLWIPLKQRRRFYEKFSSGLNLLYKDPDDLLDPCPYIPRCDHSRSWSAVRLERLKSRELNRLRNEELLQRAAERYRGMQDFWLKQLNRGRTEVLDNESSQARLETFRKIAGGCFNPLSEIQRFQRLQDRREEWENYWRTASERRKKNSRKKSKGRSFPRIVVTDHDNEGNGTSGIEVFSNEVDDDVRGMVEGFDETPCVQLVTATTTEPARCYPFHDNYDVICTTVNCCSNLDENLETVEDDNDLSDLQQADFVDECSSQLQYRESCAVTRKTPGYGERRGKLDPKGEISHDSTKNSQNSKAAGYFSYDNGREFMPRRSELGESVENKITNFPDSSKSQLNKPSSLMSLSSSEIGLDPSLSIEGFTGMSKSSLSSSSMLLNDSIRQADNTVQLMSHLVPTPLGVSTSKIPDENFMASSVSDVYHSANQARLHNEKKDANGGAWIPKHQDTNPYLQVDFGQVLTIQQVATQGNPASAVKQERHKRWVTKYSLQFSEDGKKWIDYEESGGVKIFTGNSDMNTVVLNSLESPVETRFVRFIPKEWHTGIAMRVEVFGPKTLPETDLLNENKKSPRAELRLNSSDSSGSDVKDTVKNDKEIELEMLYSGIDGNPVIGELGVLEERVITPVILHSPVPFLISPDVPDIKQNKCLESKLYQNSLPAPKVKKRKSPTSDLLETSTAFLGQMVLGTKLHKTCDQEQRKPKMDHLSRVKDPKRTSSIVRESRIKSQQIVPQPNAHCPQDKPETKGVLVPRPRKSMFDDPPRLLDDNLPPPGGNSKEDLERPRMDGSIQWQSKCEKMAKERRKKLALLKSRKTERSSEATKAPALTKEIDELGSFLEKYCIIGKAEMTIYKTIFGEFDEDEDGFLWPEEVLEALENVNTNLMTDSHLSYVFRILEHCDCHAGSTISLRLFSVIAALSQRVAALNDKMKLLISRCDFKTIDCTLLRAKMLFECYVNEDTKKISRKNLWVGLVAGGLTNNIENIDDWFQGRQSFDFLDFLTYLPLFQVIHGNVIENPLTAFQWCT